MGSFISLGAVRAHSISSDELDSLIRLDSADALRLYLWLLKNGGGEPEAAASALALSDDRIALALSTLKQAGLTGFSPAKPRMDYEMPAEYAPADISAALDSDQAFKWLIEDSSRRLGRVFSTADMAVMLRIYRWIGLPAEVIGMLVTYCIDQARRRSGEGRMPTLRQIEKEALVWDANAITSVGRADDYVKKITLSRQKRGTVLTRLGISDVTSSVERYIDQWLDWGFGEDELYHALDLTVRNTGGMKFPYMNSIVKNWHEKGLLTLADIKKKDRKPGSGPGVKSVPGQREKDIVKRNQSYREDGRDV